jgi:hypothetical protein
MRYYVLQRGDGAFVTMPGSEKSYTRTLRKARSYSTAEAAQRDACGNETPVPVESLLPQPDGSSPRLVL